MLLRPEHANPTPPHLYPPSNPHLPFTLRFFFTAFRGLTRPKLVDISAWAHQFQTRRLWTYALTFSCIAGFDVIVLNSFQDQLVFNNKFQVGGLVLEGSVVQLSSLPEMEFEGLGWGSRRRMGIQMRETVAMTLAWRQMSRLLPLSILGRPVDWLGLGASLFNGLEWIDRVPTLFFDWVLGYSTSGGTALKP